MFDLLTVGQLSLPQIEWLIARAAFYKQQPVSSFLKARSIGLIFEKASTRTRLSSEVAIVRLGGHPIFLSTGDMQLKRGETLADSARVLSRYLDALIIRTYGHDTLKEWAYHATIPVINGLTDLHHPAQILSDLFTLVERRRQLKGLKLVYIGDSNNIAHSLIEGGAITGMEVVISHPEGFGPNPEVVSGAALLGNGRLSFCPDPIKAVKGADVIYTDTWVSMGQEHEEDQRAKRFSGYQVATHLLEGAKTDVLVMHCLPAHRGHEITDEVMDGPHSIVFDQAANRLPMQQAILEACMDEGGSCL